MGVFEEEATVDFVVLFIEGTAGDEDANGFEHWCVCSAMHVVEGDQAAVSRFDFRVLAAFLLDEIVLDAAGRFSGSEDLFPGSAAFSE